VGGRQGLAPGEADRFAEEGRALLERVGDDLLVNYGNCCIFGARFEEGGAAIAEAESLAEACGRQDLLVLALTTGAFSFMARGRLARALELNGRALSALEDGGGEGEGYRAGLVSMRAGTLWLMGSDDEALECSDRMLELGEDPTHSEWIATHHALHAVVSADRGRPDEALRRVARCVEIGERAHNTNVLIHGLLTLAAIQRRRGQWQDALEACARARKEIEDSGILQAETRLLCQLAASQLGAGDPTQALATAEQAVVLSREREQLYGVEAQRVRAAALRTLRGADAEEELLDALERAERLMEETGARHYAGPLHRERAEVCGVLGDGAGARRELELAIAAYQERSASAGAGEAERRMAALAG